MIEGDEPRDLAALVVPQAGRLEHAEDPWQPYRLCDPAGGVVAPVAAYLRELHARGRPETTLRAYAIALLRWFRYLWATGVPRSSRSAASALVAWVISREDRLVGFAPNAVMIASWIPRLS